MMRVVMGLLFDNEGKILIAKRNREKMYGGLWEFPGGKIKAEEEIGDALTREIFEELRASIKILKIYPSYIFKNSEIQAEFIPVIGRIHNDEIVLREHEECKFITMDEIIYFKFAPPDYDAVQLLKTL
ncbi:NUDIX domain-containing protein [Desulfopila inferna]|uniref:NUDIX domain-containing protein n=1 Tax=Desulfopila inferna TaxID=468528 RepID=UPI001962D16E|nr:NUDIX domain-containing protein [Desulfopila inferna]MBM9604110.1 NUDIX domain-containing protein [Desulfopila inferna]